MVFWVSPRNCRVGRDLRLSIKAISLLSSPRLRTRVATTIMKLYVLRASQIRVPAIDITAIYSNQMIHHPPETAGAILVLCLI